MTERRAHGGGLSASEDDPRAAEPLARLSDHLGRLLAHADQLLLEWQAHADGVRGRFEKEGAVAGEALARALREALAEIGPQAGAELGRALGTSAEALRADLERARRAAAELEAHARRAAGAGDPDGASGAGRAPAVLVALGLLSSLLAAAVLFVVLRRPAPAVPDPAPPGAGSAPIGAVALGPDAAPPDAARAARPDAGVPAAAPCGALRVATPTTTPKLVAACLTEVCGAGGAAKALPDCAREDAAGADLVAALRAAARERPLHKLACAPPRPDAEGRYAVTVRWLLDCAAVK